MVVIVEAIVAAGESLPLFRLRTDVAVIKVSSMSVLTFVPSADSLEELSSASSGLTLWLHPSLARANAEMFLAACRVERRTVCGGSALKILVVS